MVFLIVVLDRIKRRLFHLYIHFTWQCLVLDAIKQREVLNYLALFSPSVICSGSNIPSCLACQQQVITNRVHHEIPLDLSSHISISGVRYQPACIWILVMLWYENHLRMFIQKVRRQFTGHSFGYAHQKSA